MDRIRDIEVVVFDVLGTLVDQSEINSTKYGLRTSYTRPDFLLKGLELRFGVDLVHDTTQQELALTRRVWVPPLKYDSVGPYVQLSYDMGPITVSGGWRHEDGKVHVDDYTTTYFRNRAFVKGGDLKYKNDLFNAGVIGRLGGGFSVFGSYSEGFTLPNVGIPLRNVNYPGQSVNGILDLQAVVFKNKEIGANWRGSWGSFGASYYRSFSKLGSNSGYGYLVGGTGVATTSAQRHSKSAGARLLAPRRITYSPGWWHGFSSSYRTEWPKGERQRKNRSAVEKTG